MMLISYCIPCHNRTYDLKKTLPSIIASANNSPPVEIAILDYNSPDDLRDYFFETYGNTEIREGNFLTYKRYGARDYYHTSHANNLSVLISSGEYVIIGCTDIILSEEYFVEIRKLLEEGDIVWMQATRHINLVVCRRDEFMDAGGFDERFELYSPNDKDFESRLRRRGGKFVLYPGDLVTMIPTSKKEKYKNYRITSRLKIKKLMNPIFLENERKGILVANEDGEWGKWD